LYLSGHTKRKNTPCPKLRYYNKVVYAPHPQGAWYIPAPPV